ncbi:calvin cycle protein CP12-3, chloroplastic-like [Phalaenopsis equestris]|uniref:calvin cycle protein CP12-3, chloroplastic-like n=1 Tax=Phalaenopsis equestris TaxID=78828 RepID=UPI0009E4FAC0|nr:calvin cycle protein CP12-3, chloroplastic-like [Phalaenopsis equestris]
MACLSSPSWSPSCPPLRRSAFILTTNSLPTLSIAFSRSHRGQLALAAGSKRYWGTAMRELNLAKMVERKVADAMEVCNGEDGMRSDGCRVAWDEVEEVSSALADLRRRLADSPVDPLEPLCLQKPNRGMPHLRRLMEDRSRFASQTLR